MTRVMLRRPRLQALVKKHGTAHPGGRLYWGGLKDFADGSLGSRTALMQEPYADDTATRGIRLSPYAELQELVQQADATGLQVNELVGLLGQAYTQRNNVAAVTEAVTVNTPHYCVHSSRFCSLVRLL